MIRDKTFFRTSFYHVSLPLKKEGEKEKGQYNLGQFKLILIIYFYSTALLSLRVQGRTLFLYTPVSL